MKKNCSIFIFLFSMIFTVFQYIPIIEEDVQGDNTELAKKNTEDDSFDDNDETDTDVDDALNNFLSFNFINTHTKAQFLSTNKRDYNSFFQKINIPPPKI